MKLLIAFFLICGLTGVAMADPLEISTPVLEGTPGSTVVWGFTLHSDPFLWITVNSSQFLLQSNPSIAGPNGYFDLIGFQGGPTDFLLPPGDPDWVQAGNLALFTGFGAFDISEFALPGSANIGQLTVIYTTFTDNPYTCGSCVQDAGLIFSTYGEVRVLAPEPPPTTGKVPESNSGILLGVGLTVLGFGGAAFRRKTGQIAS